MNLKYIYTRLHVQNYLDCKRFYEDILGLKVSLANDVEEYAEFDVVATKITILNRSQLKDYIDSIESATYDSHDAKIILSFAVPDLDEAFAKRLHQENLSVESQRRGDLQQSLATSRRRGANGWVYYRMYSRPRR
jgi:catechol 2,3-dioxygenase-like lactoylglutathione lyase family enzyme